MSGIERLERLFSKRLLLVSGKGGVGKTSVAAALASLAARSGRRTLLLSTDGRGDAAALFGRPDAGYEEVEVEPGLRLLTADFDALLEDFTRTNVPVPIVAGRILASSTFRYFTRATPGLPELLLLGKVRQIYLPLFGRHPKKRVSLPYDLVVVDAPATGHALSLVAFPRTVLKVVPAGPLKRLADDLDGLLQDGDASALVIVAEPAELAAREAEELAEGARKRAGLATGLVVINRTGRTGAPETLPRLELPSLRVPELSTEDDPQLLREMVDVVAGGAPPAHVAARERFRLSNPPLVAARWLGEGRLLVLAGPGGVGKTTLAAAAGIAAARAGRRTLVITVDPARRLSQALGLGGRADTPVPVTVRGVREGTLSAMQIDPRASFERLLKRIASPQVVERIHRNRFYDGLVDSLPGVLEYMGVEALAENVNDPALDLVVLDTPPAARGIDFLKAPERMVELLENDALRWFLRSDSLLSKALTGASRAAGAVLRLADRALGFGFLSDMADFFHAFEGLYDGFKERSREVSARLRSGRFLLVTSLDRTALATAASTAEALAAAGLETGLLVNRVPEHVPRSPELPASLAALPARAIAETPDGTELPSLLADALAR